MRKRRLFWIILILTAAAILLYLCYKFDVKPYIVDAAKTCIINAASDEIQQTVCQELLQSNDDFSSYVILEKDVKGNITAIRTNMALVNDLKNRIMNRISENLYSLDEKTLSIPLGTMFFPSFFGMSGPHLQTQIVSLSSVDSTIETSIEEAGINQAQQIITIHVQIDMTVLSPVGRQLVTVRSDVPIAQTMIVGLIPNTYLENFR